MTEGTHKRECDFYKSGILVLKANHSIPSMYFKTFSITLWKISGWVTNSSKGESDHLANFSVLIQ